MSKKSIKDNTFSSYIHKILKKTHPDSGISSNASLVLSRISLYLIRKYAEICSSILINANKKMVGIPTIYSATYIIYETDSLMISNIFAESTIKKMDEAIKLYIESEPNSKDKIRRETRAGLHISVSRIKKVYKSANVSNRSISDICCVAIAAAIEYLLTEIIDIAGNVSRDSKLTRITPRHILLAIAHDTELETIILSNKLIIGGGGVIPDIKYQLLPSKRMS